MVAKQPNRARQEGSRRDASCIARSGEQLASMHAREGGGSEEEGLRYRLSSRREEKGGQQCSVFSVETTCSQFLLQLHYCLQLLGKQATLSLQQE